MSAVQLEKKLLHYTGKAIADYRLISTGDKILIGLSGGKDSYTLVKLLKKLYLRSRHKFEIFALTLDQGQPGWNDQGLRQWLKDENIPHEILHKNTYKIVTEKIPENKTYCSLCSRLRRGIIYQYAKDHGFNKIALGHHRDDLIRSLLLSIFYRGSIASMPPKLLTDDKSLIVIRPLVYCQEADIAAYAKALAFPIIPCNLCGSQENLMRKEVGVLINQLAERNPKIPSNILHALTKVEPSHLMDSKLWDFKNLKTESEIKMGLEPV